MRDLLGGKGAGVAEMTNAGLPVPPGFTITTEACNAYYDAGKQFPDGMWEQTLAALQIVEQQTGKGFGDHENPLLVSVRSGAKFSMPGMMDTVLNLGINDETVQGLIALTGDERFAYDAYRRFIQMFCKIVLDTEPDAFEQMLEEYKERDRRRRPTPTSPPTRSSRWSQDFKQIARDASGKPFPDRCLRAVAQSHRGRLRLLEQQTRHRLPQLQQDRARPRHRRQRADMVFGNMGNDSGTGVAFTRNPCTGEQQLYGEYLLNAQGEDVVAGIRTPPPSATSNEDLPQRLPAVQGDRAAPRTALSRHAGPGVHRRARPAVHAADALGQAHRAGCRQGRRGHGARGPDQRARGRPARRALPGRVSCCCRASTSMDIARAKREERRWQRASMPLPARPSAKPSSTPTAPRRRARPATPVVLVRPETSPDDVHGMLVAKGILTARGGTTSHAAVVARGLGLPCVAGCEGIRVDYEKRQLPRRRQRPLSSTKATMISIDGATGEVFAGIIKTRRARSSRKRPTCERCSAGPTVPPPGRLGQRGLPARRETRHHLRRTGHRPLPHRAHVHGAGAPADRAGR